MNHLLARTKGRGEQFYKIMSQNDVFFELADLSDTHAFTGSYILGEGEWYKVTNFSGLGYSNELIEGAFNTTNYSQLPQSKYVEMIYFVAKQGNNFLFQKITASQMLNKKWFHISGAPTLEKNKPIIILNPCVDAIYDSAADILYFRDFPKVKTMFKGIEALYRIATQTEVETFLSSDFIALQGQYSAENVKPANRKRIAEILDAMNQLSPQKKKKLIDYIKSYCRDLPTSGGAFKIGSEEQLKRVLYGIDERYYTTQL